MPRSIFPYVCSILRNFWAANILLKVLHCFSKSFITILTLRTDTAILCECFCQRQWGAYWLNLCFLEKIKFEQHKRSDQDMKSWMLTKLANYFRQKKTGFQDLCYLRNNFFIIIITSESNFLKTYFSYLA